MKILSLFLVLVLTQSKENHCENLEITTTVDKPGNVMKNGLYQPDWFSVPFKSFTEAEKITFFIQGLSEEMKNSSFFKVLHDDDQENLQKRWVNAQVVQTYTLKNLSNIFAVEVLQECLFRDGWRATELTLILDSTNCPSIKWPRICGNPARVLSSFNLGFLEHTSELITKGVVNNELFDVHAGALISKKGKYSGNLYLWSSFDEDLDIRLNISYKLIEKKQIVKEVKKIEGVLESNSFELNINFSCPGSSGGEKSVYLTISLSHLHDFTIFYKFRCPEETSSSYFRVFLTVLLLLFFLVLLSVLFFRFQDTLASLTTQVKTFFSPKLKSSYLPDREFPDVEFNDLTFKSPSQAYGTFN